MTTRSLATRISSVALGVATAAVALSLGVDAKADGTQCGPRKAVLETLSRAYDEAPVAIGLASGGGVLELLTSKQGTWTVLMTLPTGITCLMADGESWTEKKRPVAGASL